MLTKHDKNLLLRHDLYQFGDDEKLHLVGADIRSEQDEHDFDAVELETCSDWFLKIVIEPRQELIRPMGSQIRLFDDDGDVVVVNGQAAFKEIEMWPPELVRLYNALRNGARMTRPEAIRRIRRRRAEY